MPYPLVDDVDDQAFGVRRQLCGEIPRELGRRLEVDGEMPIPVDPIEILGNESSMKSDAELTRRLSGPSAALASDHDLRGGSHVGQVGLDHDSAAALGNDALREFIGVLVRVVAMDRDGEPMRREIFHDGPADPLGAAGYKGSFPAFAIFRLLRLPGIRPFAPFQVRLCLVFGRQCGEGPSALAPESLFAS